MSIFEKAKLDEGATGSRGPWQTLANHPAVTSPKAAHASSPSVLGARHLPAGVDAAAAATALSHWAEPQSPKHEGWGLGDAWRGIKGTATGAYNAISGMTDTAGKYLHRAEQGFDHGVDAAENQLQRPSRWIADQAQDIPGVNRAAQGYASLSKHTTELLGGAVKGASSAVFGLGNVAVHPIDTLQGLATMGSHLPGSPFWMLRQGYHQAKGLYDVAAHGAHPSTALSPLSTLKEDAGYLKGVGAQLSQPYRAAVKEGKPTEAVGRGVFDIGSLFLGAGEVKAAAEAGEVSKASELSKLGEAPPVRPHLTSIMDDAPKIPQATDLAKAEEVTDASKGAKLTPIHSGEEAATHADVGLADRGYHPQAGERSMTKEQWQAQERRRRAEQTTGHADQQLEPVNPDKAQHGHGHGDHGHQTTADQQGARIRTGITPSGRAGKPVSKASHFHTSEAEAEAIGRARRQLQADQRAGAVTELDAAGEPTRHSVTVPTNRRDGFGHRVVKERDAAGAVIKDASGQPLTKTDPTPLRQAKVIWEHVPSKHDWHPVTYFPE